MPNNTKRFDVVVVGGGHNGLVTAAYLSKKGLKVCVLEKRHSVGGCAITEEKWPGYKISSLSYVNSLFHPKIIQDLELKKHGFEMLPRNPSSFTPFADGRYLLLGPDPEMNRKEISKFSAKDAENYPLYEEYLTEISEVMEPVMTMEPIAPNQWNFANLWHYVAYALKHRKRLKRKWSEILRIMAISASDLLDEWFESPQLKTTLASDAIIGANQSPKTPGTAYILFHHVMGECDGVRGVWGYMRGGMGGLSESIANACKAMGVEIYTSQAVKKIIIQNGKATGVLTEDGNTYEADIVASGADPSVTFEKLIDAKDLEVSFLRNIRRINYDSASVKVNLTLKELPDFLACPGTEPGPQHRGTIHLCPDMDYLEKAFQEGQLGYPSQHPVLECTIPSTIDNTLAPEGKHVMNIFCQYGPYKLHPSTNWDKEREIFLNRVLEVLYQAAPNLRSAIENKEIITPVDLEREYNITGGNIFHGRMSLEQLFNMRPVPGYSNYRTPIRSLYLCGSGAHPGGGVMGIPGMNAAKAIHKDRAKFF